MLNHLDTQISDGSAARTWALVTGASSGIGEHFAYELSRQKSHNILLVARREERLKRISETCNLLLRESIRSDESSRALTVEYRIQDLSKPDQRIALCDYLRQSNKEVELLINNAGFGSVTDFLESPLERQLEMVELNALAPIDLMSRLQSDWTTVINVCSAVAFGPLPGMATYAATKAFLLHHSVAVNEELRGSGRKVIAVCPGLTESEFHLVSGLEKKMNVMRSMSATKVVNAALSGARRGKPIVVPGALNLVLVRLARLLGLVLPARIARFFVFRHRGAHQVSGD